MKLRLLSARLVCPVLPGFPRRPQASQETSSLQPPLRLPWGLLVVGGTISPGKPDATGHRVELQPDVVAGLAVAGFLVLAC